MNEQRTIWKWPIPIDQPTRINIPTGANIVHVRCETEHSVTIWAEVNRLCLPEEREFVVVGTGHSIPPSAQYVGTGHAPNLPLVWHLYEIAAT